MRNTSLLTSALLALGFAAASPASAHINMDGPLKDRGGDQKTAPCGGRERGVTTYTFEPGATITLGVTETIAHDGYFRISFDDDGADGFKDPQSIAPINPDRYGSGKKCQGTPEDRCGESDFCNVMSSDGGPTVLWDNLDPHLGASSGRNKKWSWTVTLPNVECDNCTLQVMQVMEDPLGSAHGPFDGEDDLYYRCVDIVLKKGAGGTTGVATGTPNNKGVDCVKQAGGPSAETADASVPTVPTDPGGKSDAGSTSSADAGVSKPPAEKPLEEDDDEGPSTPVVDAGRTRDASTAKPPSKDAGTAAGHDDDDHGDDRSGEGDDDEEEPTVDGDDESEADDASAGADDGCSISQAQSGSRALGGLLGSMLALGLLLARRRRHDP